MDQKDRGRRVQRFRDAVRPIRDRQAAEDRQSKDQGQQAREAAQTEMDRFREIEARATRFFQDELQPLMQDFADAIGGGTLQTDGHDSGRNAKQTSQSWFCMFDDAEVHACIRYSLVEFHLEAYCRCDMAQVPVFSKRQACPVAEFDETSSLDWLTGQLEDAARYLVTHRIEQQASEP